MYIQYRRSYPFHRANRYEYIHTNMIHLVDPVIDDGG